MKRMCERERVREERGKGGLERERERECVREKERERETEREKERGRDKEAERDCTNPQKFYLHSKSGMGWLRVVGSLKLYVSFAKEPYK